MTLHLIRASQLAPYAGALGDLPNLLEPLLRKHWLPMPSRQAPEGLVLEAHSWAFLEDVARVTGRRNLGWELGSQEGLGHLGPLGEDLLSQPDLLSAFSLLLESLPSFSNASRPELREGDGLTWFCRGSLPGKGGGFWQIEQYAAGAYINLIQHYAGPGWYPPRLRLQAKRTTFSRSALASCCADIEGGAVRLQIAIEPELLNYANPVPTCKPVRSNHPPMPTTVGDALYQLLDQYVGDYPLSIETAGHALNLHPRTIIRRLACEGLRFRDIRDCLREKRGKQLLISSDLPAAEIARQLSYNHPGNFSRAIKRMTGMTPTEVRLSGQI